MNDILAHNSTILRDNLIVDSSSSSASSSSSMDKLAHEDIIDGFSFLTFEFESELRKEFEKKRVEFSKTSGDNCSSSSSSVKSRKKQKTATSGTKAKSVAKTTSSAASNSSLNDDQASVTAESTSAPTEEPRPPKSRSPQAPPLPAADDEQPSKKPKLDEAAAAPTTKSSYDMNTLLAAAASAAATAAVVAATGSSKTAPSAPNQLPPSVDYNSNPFLAGIGPNQSDPASSFINKIMEMCKQQIPNLNIPGILSKTEPNEPASAKQSPTTSKHLTPSSATFNHQQQQPNQQQQQQPHHQQQQQQHSNIQKQVTNNNNISNQQSVNTNPYSYMPYQKSAPIESAKYATMPMMSASGSNDALMYSHVSKLAPLQIAKPVIKAAGLTQYYPRTNGKWCAAHAKIANMIQEQKSKNSLASKHQKQQQQQQQQQHQQQQQQQIHNHNNQQPMYTHQQMFDAYHTKKLHTPTFFPPVQHNLKQQQPLPGPPAPQQQHQQQQTPKSNKSGSGTRGHNLLATEAAITAAAANHHQMMMDKYRHDMMRMSGPNIVPGPPGMPFMPPPPPLTPGMHMPMPPFMAKSKKPVHPGVPLPPPPAPTSSHMAPFNPNPLVQHSFLQQFFMDKNFDPTRFAMPPGLPPPPPPGCLMPNMLKPDDKPIT